MERALRSLCVQRHGTISGSQSDGVSYLSHFVCNRMAGAQAAYACMFVNRCSTLMRGGYRCFWRLLPHVGTEIFVYMRKFVAFEC